MTTRVIVTGLGVVSPVGNTLEEFWDALLYQESSPQEVPYVRTFDMPHRLAYRLRAEPAAASSPASGSRTIRFAVHAARLALQDAGLLPSQAASPIGICLGTATGNHDIFESERDHGPAAPADAYPFSVTAPVARQLGLEGPIYTVSTACAAGCYSVSLAAEAILSGRADVMVVGGADCVSRVSQACFNRMSAVDHVCRPFDADRKGTIYGEGAAVLILESEQHAARRGHTRHYAAVEGCGWSCDGHHPTAPDPAGRQIQLALHRALADAGLTIHDIDCIVAHGTGTELNDVAESSGMEHVFGAGLARIPVFAPKSKLGHTAGAAGAFACLIATLIVDRGLVPPTANLTTLDPRCKLRLHTDWPVSTSARHVLVNAYAFGGNNISVIVGAA